MLRAILVVGVFAKVLSLIKTTMLSSLHPTQTSAHHYFDPGLVIEFNLEVQFNSMKNDPPFLDP